jgi:hemolysin III
LATVVLAVVWTAAFAGALLKLVWIDGPKWVTALAGAAYGWVGAAMLPQVALSNGMTAVALVGFGGLLYSVGVVIYVLRRPNPVPAVFGYHEIFHALVIAAAAAHFASIAVFVLPQG